MAKKRNGSKVWIAGAILGAVAGAAYALWKTPMSGQELRSKLTPGPVGQRDDAPVEQPYSQGVGDKILSKVEHTIAPVVGVELGKTANGSGSSNGAITEPISAVKAPPAEKPVTTATPASAEPAKAPETPGTGTESIRAKRFAWGAPTPEAGLDPVPAESLISEAAPEPEPKPTPSSEPAQEPVAATVSTSSGSTYGSDSIRAKRFAWGDPAPETASTPPMTSTTSQPTETVEMVAESTPLEPATSAADKPGANMRQFPKLGGLEN